MHFLLIQKCSVFSDNSVSTFVRAMVACWLDSATTRMCPAIECGTISKSTHCSVVSMPKIRGNSMSEMFSRIWSLAVLVVRVWFVHCDFEVWVVIWRWGHLPIDPFLSFFVLSNQPFISFVAQHAHLNQYVDSVARAPSHTHQSTFYPDLPISWFASEFIQSRQLTSEQLDEFYLFNFVYVASCLIVLVHLSVYLSWLFAVTLIIVWSLIRYQTLDNAWDLFNVGLSSLIKCESAYTFVNSRMIWPEFHSWIFHDSWWLRWIRMYNKQYEAVRRGWGMAAGWAWLYVHVHFKSNNFGCPFIYSPLSDWLKTSMAIFSSLHIFLIFCGYFRSVDHLARDFPAQTVHLNSVVYNISYSIDGVSIAAKRKIQQPNGQVSFKNHLRPSLIVWIKVLLALQFVV